MYSKFLMSRQRIQYFIRIKLRYNNVTTYFSTYLKLLLINNFIAPLKFLSFFFRTCMSINLLLLWSNYTLKVSVINGEKY